MIIFHKIGDGYRILVKQTAQGIIDIRQRLLEVRDRLEHGQFLHWIETEFGWKKSTAYNLINVASNFQQVGNFDFSPKVLYLLAAPSVPEEARQEALSLAESGEKYSSTELSPPLATPGRGQQIEEFDLLNKSAACHSSE